MRDGEVTCVTPREAKTVQAPGCRARSERPTPTITTCRLAQGGWRARPGALLDDLPQALREVARSIAAGKQAVEQAANGA
jgi:hypothetical protein